MLGSQAFTCIASARAMDSLPCLFPIDFYTPNTIISIFVSSTPEVTPLSTFSGFNHLLKAQGSLNTILNKTESRADQTWLLSETGAWVGEGSPAEAMTQHHMFGVSKQTHDHTGHTWKCSHCHETHTLPNSGKNGNRELLHGHFWVYEELFTATGDYSIPALKRRKLGLRERERESNIQKHVMSMWIRIVSLLVLGRGASRVPCK